MKFSEDFVVELIHKIKYENYKILHAKVPLKALYLSCIMIMYTHITISMN